MLTSFFIRVKASATDRGRLMHVKPAGGPFTEGDGSDRYPAEIYQPVDVRDTRTRVEAQGIFDIATSRDRGALTADSQFRDAVRSAYLNATGFEAGDPISGGTALPDDFTVTILED